LNAPTASILAPILANVKPYRIPTFPSGLNGPTIHLESETSLPMSMPVADELALRHAFAATAAKLEAMRGGGIHTARFLREGASTPGRIRAAVAGFLPLGRSSTLTRYLCCDVAVVGGNALLGAVAATRAVAKGLSTVLAVESRMDDLPDGLTSHFGFRVWLDRLLGLSEGLTALPGVSTAVDDALSEVARSFTRLDAGRRLLVRFGSGSLTSLADRRADGEAMLTVGPRPAPAGADAAAERLLAALPCAYDYGAIPPATRTAVFARRVVVAGLAPGLATPPLTPREDGAASGDGGPALRLFGTAARVARRADTAVADYMGDLLAVAEGRHLAGLAARIR
jgi:hypothetical protein